MGQEIFQVDAFTDRPFLGNPAGVCLLEQPRSDSWMQSIAAEMNLSETAFLYREPQGYNLRWFTPAMEVDLCGHATLASAHILWQVGALREADVARFQTRSGQLTAWRGEGGWIEMDFPSDFPEALQEAGDVTRALGVSADYVGRGRFDYLVMVESENMVRGIKPDFTALRALPARGTIVTALSDRPEFDFVSRFFAPAAGIDEDPVTGSAHCTLAPFWASRLEKTSMVGFQASARSGIVGVRIEGDRVILRGQAVTVLQGQFSVAASKLYAAKN